MSEVNRYYAGNIDKDREVCLAADFDRVTAERDAALESLRIERGVLGVANETIASLADEIQRLQQRLTAADERADVLAKLLREGLEEYKDGDDWIERVIAALKPAEGTDYRKSCEAAHKALSMGNQRITPARFKCLACGEYHEGSGNLPCPSMSPYSRIKP